MKKNRKFLNTPAAALILFLIAAALLLTGGIGGTRAVLGARSEMYSSRLQMKSIAVSLWENDAAEPVAIQTDNMVSGGNTGVLCKDLLGEDDILKIGKKYDEALYVKNSGSIDSYVRVTVYKYWADADGNKLQYRKDDTGADLIDSNGKKHYLDPALIDLNFLYGSNGWILDESSSTSERTVLYYNSPLAPGDQTPTFTDTLMIRDTAVTKVTETVEEVTPYTVIHMTYDYDGLQFVLEAEVDAVQTHNARDAILSAWGRDLTFSGDTITAIN